MDLYGRAGENRDGEAGRGQIAGFARGLLVHLLPNPGSRFRTFLSFSIPELEVLGRFLIMG